MTARMLVPVVAVLALLGFAARRHVPVAAAYFDRETCIGCHGRDNEHLLGQWMGSAQFFIPPLSTVHHPLRELFQRVPLPRDHMGRAPGKARPGCDRAHGPEGG